jgi:phage shock protein A
MGIFNRLFKIGEAEANSMVDKLEDPTKMTEQGIRDMKVDLDNSIKALAEVKALAIRSKNEAEQYKQQATEYEQKAILLLQRAQQGAMPQAEADRLAGVALQKKEECQNNLKRALGDQQKFDSSVAKLDTNIKKLKDNISMWENEAKTLKARAKVSEATQKVNKQLASIDSSSTVNMLNRMKEKVEQQEALSESYAEIANENKSVDDEIESALDKTSLSSSDALTALKAKMANKELTTGTNPPA